MAYKCLDCSYKGEKFVGGACPGCGSNNISRIKHTEQKQPKARKPYTLALCIALWGYCVYSIFDKLLA